MFGFLGFKILTAAEYAYFLEAEADLVTHRKALKKAREALTKCLISEDGSSKKISELNSTIERKDKELLSSGETLADVQKKYDKCSSNNKKIMTSLKEKSLETAKLNTENDGLQRENKALRENNIELIGENETLKSKVSYLEGQIALFQKYIGELPEMPKPEEPDGDDTGDLSESVEPDGEVTGTEEEMPSEGQETPETEEETSPDNGDGDDTENAEPPEETGDGTEGEMDGIVVSATIPSRDEAVPEKKAKKRRYNKKRR